MRGEGGEASRNHRLLGRAAGWVEAVFAEGPFGEGPLKITQELGVARVSWDAWEMRRGYSQ